MSPSSCISQSFFVSNLISLSCPEIILTSLDTTRVVDRSPLAVYTKTCSETKRSKQRRAMCERAQFRRIDRFSRCCNATYTSHQTPPDSLDGSRPTDSHRRRSRVQSTRMRPPHPSFAGERPARRSNALTCRYRISNECFRNPNSIRTTNRKSTEYLKKICDNRDNNNKIITIKIRDL